MTQNSAQTPEGQTDSRPGDQQNSTEGTQSPSTTPETGNTCPEGAASNVAGAADAAAKPQDGRGSGTSRPVTMAAKGFRNMFGKTVAPPAGEADSGKTAAASTQASAPGVADAIFDAASLAGPLALLLIMLAQAWPAFLGHNLFCPGEAARIAAFHQTAQNGMWLAPVGDGISQWPMFFWLLRGLEALLTKSAPHFAHLLFPLAAMIGTLLCLTAVWVLGRVAGLNRRAALAGGMLLLCAPIFAPLSVFTGPEAMASALTLFSLACLCHGWQKPGTAATLPVGFALAALAGLTGGLFNLVLPVLASLVFLLWRGTFRRAQKMDGLAGFVFLLVIIGCWLGAVMLWRQPDGYLKNLGTQLVAWPINRATWWKPLLLAGLGLLPWLAVICGVSWARVLRSAPADLAAARKEKAGVAFLWIALVLACLLSIPAGDMTGAAVCVACLAAPLLGKALLRLSATGAKLFYIIAALCLLHASMALLASGFGFSLDWLTKFLHLTLTDAQRATVLSLKALPVLGGLGIVAAVLLARLVRRGAHGGTSGSLVLCAIIAIVLAQPMGLMLLPEMGRSPETRMMRLDDILTPAAPAEAAPAVGAPAQEVPAAPQVAPQAEPQSGTVTPEPAQKPEPAQEVAKEPTKEPGKDAAHEAAPQQTPTGTASPAVAPQPTTAAPAAPAAQADHAAAPAAASGADPAAKPEAAPEAVPEKTPAN